MLQHNKYRISLACIMVAVIFYSYAQFLWQNAVGAEKSQPIMLNQAGNYDFEFIAARDGNYELSLQIERDRASATQHCLLGLQNSNCTDIEEKLNIAWSVLTNGKMIHAGQSQKTNRGSIGPTINKVFEGFSANKGQLYNISIQVKEPDERLSEANMVIAINALLRKETAIKQYFYSAIAAVFLLLAGLIGLFTYFKNKVDAGKSNESDKPLS